MRCYGLLAIGLLGCVAAANDPGTSNGAADDALPYPEYCRDSDLVCAQTSDGNHRNLLRITDEGVVELYNEFSSLVPSDTQQYNDGTYHASANDMSALRAAIGAVVTSCLRARATPRLVGTWRNLDQISGVVTIRDQDGSGSYPTRKLLLQWIRSSSNSSAEEVHYINLDERLTILQIANRYLYGHYPTPVVNDSAVTRPSSGASRACY